MKRLLNYTIIISLSLVVFGCGGPTIDVESDEFRKNITFTKDELKQLMILYKGDPYNGTFVKYRKNGGGLDTKSTIKDGKIQVEETYNKDGQLGRKETYNKDGKTVDSSEQYDKEGKVTHKDGIEVK